MKNYDVAELEVCDLVEINGGALVEGIVCYFIIQFVKDSIVGAYEAGYDAGVKNR